MNILLWVLQIALALLFLMAGGMKFAASPQAVEMFGKIGLGGWFLYFTGAMEVLAGIMLLIPRRSGWGAALVIPIMIGATISCLFILHMSAVLPIVCLAVACFILWKRGL